MMHFTLSGLFGAIFCLWLGACEGPGATRSGHLGSADQGQYTETEQHRMQRIINGVR